MSTSLQAAASSALPGPEDILRCPLDNGVVVLSRANHNSPSVVIHGSLTAGGLFDPDEKLGLADFTAQALLRGTQAYGFQEIYARLESAGAGLAFSSGTHTVAFSGRTLVEDLDMLLDLLGEALIRPVFPPDQVERLRAELLTSLAIRAQDTAEMASLAFNELVYADHPYSRPDDGVVETIQAITRQDLVEFHRRCYGPRSLILAITGAVDPLAAAEKAAVRLGGWTNGQQEHLPPLPPLARLQGRPVKKVTIAGKAQADLVLGATGPARTSPDYLPASLANSVLGQFGLMGRVGEAVREQAGLAYYVSSSLSGGPGPGPWTVSAGVDPANAARASELILQEIARLASEPVPPEELADTQASFIGSLPLSLESNAGVATGLVRLERYGLGLDYLRRYAGLVQAVTPEEALAAVQRYLDPDHIGTAVAGP